MTTVSLKPGPGPAVVRAGTALLILVMALVVGLGAAASPFAMLGLALIVVFAVAVLVDTQVATLSAVFLIYLNLPGVATQVHGAPAAAGGLFVLLLLVPFLIDVRRGEPIRLTGTLGVMVLLLIATAFSTVMSAYQDLAIAGLEKQIVEGLLLYFLVTNVIRTRDVLRRALWMIIIAGSILAVFSIYQGITGAYFRPFFGFAQPDPASFAAGAGDAWRASGPFADPNYYGQILVVAIAVALVFCWRERTGLLRLSAAAAALLMLYAVALTFSRGAGVALVVLIVAMGFMRYFRAWQMAAMVLGVVALLAVVPSYVERVATITSAGASSEVGADPEADLSAQQRSTEMVAAYNVFLDHYVVGVGPAVFPAYYRRYAQATGGAIHERERSGAAKGEEAQREAHNIFLDIASSLGLLGLLAFLGVIGTAFAAAWRVRRADLAAADLEAADLATAVLLALSAYLLTGMFLSLAYERYFWLLLGLAGAATFVLRPAEPVRHVTARRVTLPALHSGRR